MTTSDHTRLLNFEGAINTVVFIHWNGLLDWNIVKFISYATMITTLHYDHNTSLPLMVKVTA